MTPLPPSGSDLDAELQRIVRQLRTLRQITPEAGALAQGMLDRWVVPAGAPDLTGRPPAQVADVLAAIVHDLRSDDGAASMARDLTDLRRALS